MRKLKHLFIEVGIDSPTLGFTLLRENFLFLRSHKTDHRLRENEFKLLSASFHL